MKKSVIAASLLIVSGGGLALAQTVGGIDVAGINERAERDANDQAAFAREVARRAEAMTNDAAQTAAEAQEAARIGVRGMRVGSDGLVDFDAVLADSERMREDRGRAPQLIVFVSLSMPEDALRVLIKDTAKAGGAVVFRGFPGNSMKAFQEGIAKVVSDEGDYGNIGIDPRLFRAFSVNSVPSFVAVSSDFDACDGFECETELPPYDRMMGNVTLRHVLETFSAGRGPGASVAGLALQRLEDHGS